MEKVEVKINGFTYLYDRQLRRLYVDQSDAVGVDYKYLTENEKKQLNNYITYCL
jgi:hypothetical protein